MAALPSSQDVPLQFGPERLILFHSPHPADLGLQLEHSAADGHVRIVFASSDDDDHHQPEDVFSNNGIIEGQLQLGDVVCEAAGVNMRRPISEHMWKLTTGLMMVAPRPIEIIVAQVVVVADSSSNDDNGGGVEMVDQTNNVGTSYYQLETSENSRVSNATMHRLPGSPGAMSAMSEGSEETQPRRQQPPQPAVRNPFQDVGRFGPERRITFRTQSLGVKLHRSPTEGIVHILHAAPFKPFGNERPPRDGPDDGRLEAGDVILEVGGVDMRGKAIGPLEWADMVHFVKHVGRPLEAVVAKDKLFTRERAGVKDNVEELQERVMEGQARRREEEERKENDKQQQAEDYAREKADEQKKGEAANTNHHEIEDESNDEENQDLNHPEMAEVEETMLDNACFNIAADDICNLPCGGREADVVDDTMASSNDDHPGIEDAPKEAPEVDNNVISSPPTTFPMEDAPTAANDDVENKTKDHPWIKKPANNDDDDMISPPTSPIEDAGQAVVPAAIVTNDDSWIKSNLPATPIMSPVEEDAASPNSGDAKRNDIKTIPTTSFYSRTHPTFRKDGASCPSSPVPLSPASKGLSVPPALSPGDDESTVNAEDHVTLWSGDQSTSEPAPAATNVVATDSGKNKSVAQLGAMFSPIQNPVTAAPSTVRWNGLFSPIVTETPKSPAESARPDNEYTPDSIFNGTAMLHSSPARSDSPSGWSVTSPISEKSVASVSVTSPALSEASIRSAAVASLGLVEKDNDEKAESMATSPMSLSSHEKRTELAQTIVKSKRGSPTTREKQSSISPTADDINGLHVPQLEPTPSKPFDETAESSFHSAFLKNLRDEFDSPDKRLHVSESRDANDTDHRPVAEKTSSKKISSSTRTKKHGDTKILPKPEKRNHLLSGWAHQPEQRRRDLSPTGSTVSVGENNKATSTKKKSNNAATVAATPRPFSERSFHMVDGSDSPFVGNIKFATPTQRVPASALFSQAFVVQHQGDNADDEPTNVWWVQTDSPLFVAKKGIIDVEAKNEAADVGSASYLQFRSPARTQPPEESEVLFPGVNMSAFDMTQLSLRGNGGKSLVDGDDLESESPSFELNETIVYADSTEDAPMDCCGVTNTLCGGEDMFEGLVSNCGNSDAFRQTKEKANNVPSPRRKNLLSRLRNKGKKKSSKASDKQLGYGNLDEDNEEREAEMKGVRKAHVQLAYQNIRGKTKASASQYRSLLIDDEILI